MYYATCVLKFINVLNRLHIKYVNIDNVKICIRTLLIFHVA